jgi:hypothetical protein
MRTVPLRSLQAKLALRLAALYVVATAIAVGILIYQAYETADTLNDRELSLRAADLARYVTVDSIGAARLELPRGLPPAIAAAVNTDISLFAVAPMRSRPPPRRRTGGRRRWRGRTTRAISVLRTSPAKAASTTV